MFVTLIVMSMTIVMMIMTIGYDADCYDHDDDDLSEILVCSVITRRVAVVHLAS